MSRKKIILIVIVIIVISISVRFFTTDAIFQSYRIPAEQGSNYYIATENLFEKHPFILEGLEKADNFLESSKSNELYDYRAVSNFPSTLLISTSEAMEISKTLRESEFESNTFFMFKKFYLNHDDKYYVVGSMICFITCGSNY